MIFRQSNLLPTIAVCLLTTSLFSPWHPSNPPQAPATAIAEVIEPTTPAIEALPSPEEVRSNILAQRIVDAYQVPAPFASQVVRAAHDIGERESVDPVLLLALVGVESRFQVHAKNPSGAIGLTQTIPRWHPEKIAAIRAKGKSPFDPESNLAMGAKILAEYTQMSRGDRMRGLQRYNGALRDPKQRYAHKVMGVYRQLSHQLPSMEPNKILLAMENTTPSRSSPIP